MKHFSQDTDKSINWDKVDLEALEKLDNARAIAKIPFVITSNYRSPEHSVSVGGSLTDAHTEIPCTAFDLRCSTATQRLIMVKALLEAGFTRIGFNNNHIHIDCSKTLPQNVIWIEG